MSMRRQTSAAPLGGGGPQPDIKQQLLQAIESERNTSKMLSNTITIKRAAAKGQAEAQREAAQTATLRLESERAKTDRLSSKLDSQRRLSNVSATNRSALESERTKSERLSQELASHRSLLKVEPAKTASVASELQALRLDAASHEDTMHLPSLVAVTLKSAAHNVETSDIGYQNSEQCPHPADAGNLRLAVPITRGSSSAFYAASDQACYAAGKWLLTDDLLRTVDEDWKKGVVVLKEPTQFIHISTSKLPINLEEGMRLRTLSRAYAHTDVRQWVWKGADRIIINWPAGMPFQIMDSLADSSGQPVYNSSGIYTRSCRYLDSDETITLPRNEDGRVEWPYAHAAIALPPAFFNVNTTPEAVTSPKKFAMELAMDYSLPYSLREIVQNGNVRQPDMCVFEGENKYDILKLQEVFDRFPERYKSTLTSQLVETTRKKRALYVIPVDVETEAVRWTLEVHQTCMYTKLEIDAHYVDMSGWVSAGLWMPSAHPFQQYFVERNSPIVIDSNLVSALVLVQYGRSQKTENLSSDAMIKIQHSDLKELILFADLNTTIRNTFTTENVNLPIVSDSAIRPLIFALRMYDKTYDSEYDVKERVIALIIELIKIPGIALDPRFKTKRKELRSFLYGISVFDVAAIHAEEFDDLSLLKTLMATTPKPPKNLYRSALEYLDGNGRADLLKIAIKKLGMDEPWGLSNYPESDDEWMEDEE